jgi:hypothetical protein
MSPWWALAAVARLCSVIATARWRPSTSYRIETHIFSRHFRNHLCAQSSYSNAWLRWPSYSHTRSNLRSRIRMRGRHIRLRALAVVRRYRPSVLCRRNRRSLSFQADSHIFFRRPRAITYVRDRHIRLRALAVMMRWARSLHVVTQAPIHAVAVRGR